MTNEETDFNNELAQNPDHNNELVQNQDVDNNEFENPDVLIQALMALHAQNQHAQVVILHFVPNNEQENDLNMADINKYNGHPAG